MSPEDEAVDECYGLILDSFQTWRVISMPHSKFYSYGEKASSLIDWGTAKVFEKIDGMLDWKRYVTFQGLQRPFIITIISGK